MNWRSLLGIGKAKPAEILPLMFYNTLSGTKEKFVPLRSGVVKMYSCGPTVYDFQHIGNLRAAVFSDTLKRVLGYNGFSVRQVTNITDVGHLTSDADEGEDKMSKGLKQAGKKLTVRNMRALGKKYSKAYFDDLKKLSINLDTISFPYASDYIDEQIALIKTLEEKGYAYKISDGIYFDTARFPSYGKLGNVGRTDEKQETRITENKEKREPSDFALWKFSAKGGSALSGNDELGWDSPWGKGFPGWHAECTAMIFAELGRQIDIHTGGIEHIPIHHNNEIAQAESATGKQYVRYWLHHEHLMIEGKKISKSLGNTLLLRQLEDRGLSPLAYRYWLLTAHYKTPINFTWEALESAQTALTRLHRFFIEELGERNGTASKDFALRFRKAVNDNLDTPKALAILWDLVRDEKVAKNNKRATLLMFDKVLGLGLREGSKRLREMLQDEEKRIPVEAAPEEVRQLLTQREEARGREDWEKADKLRVTIEKRGYAVEDTDDGPSLRKL